jgi:hypothetical protein
MSKATPGPWTLETVPTQVGSCHKIGKFPCNGAFAEKGNYACVYADGVRVGEIGNAVGDELLANARLIAAAPELYAENERLRGALLRLGKAMLAGGPPDDIGPPADVAEEYYAAIDAVKQLAVELAERTSDA